jgi:hypothetical protein
MIEASQQYQQVVPARAEQVYDRWAIRELTFVGDGIGGSTVEVRATFALYGVDADGNEVRHPDNLTAEYREPSLYALASVDGDVAALITSIRDKIASRARAAGAI